MANKKAIRVIELDDNKTQVSFSIGDKGRESFYTFLIGTVMTIMKELKTGREVLGVFFTTLIDLCIEEFHENKKDAFRMSMSLMLLKEVDLRLIPIFLEMLKTQIDDDGVMGDA